MLGRVCGEGVLVLGRSFLTSITGVVERDPGLLRLDDGELGTLDSGELRPTAGLVALVLLSLVDEDE